MLSSLEALNPDSASGVHTRIRCICHILNLVVKVLERPNSSNLLISVFYQAVLSQFTAKPKSGNLVISDSDNDEPEEELPDMDLEMDEEVDVDRQTSDDQEIQELANEVDTDVRFFVGTSDLALGRSAMAKVRLPFTGVF
jgi:hypothetical protein